MNMKKSIALLESMDMPDPHFPFKMNLTNVDEYGKILFHHHWHQHIEFLYFKSGKAMIECNSKPLEVQTGDLIVVNSNDLHHGLSLSEDLSYYVMICDLALLHSHSADTVETKFMTPIAKNEILFQNKISHDPDINTSLHRIIEECKHKTYGFELAVKMQLYNLLTLLIRRYIDRFLSSNDQTTRIKNRERFTPIFRYIDKKYKEPISVTLLADIAGLSRFHFSRLFKEVTGKTVPEYVNMIRLSKSEYLLRNSSMTISEIAHATGFNDIYYFSRAFKKAKLVAPSEWRRKLIYAR